MQICPGCAFENSGQDRFCGRCGVPLSSRKHRGTELAGTYRIEHVFSSTPGCWIYNGQDFVHSKVVRIKEYVGAANLFPEISAKALIVKNLLKQLGVIDYFKEGNDFYFILQPSDYISLEEKMVARNGKAAAFNEGLNWSREILKLVHHFHTQDVPVTFGDLTPASFALTPEGAVILRDPGICFLLSRKDTIRKFSRTAFAAPEMLSLGEITPASDIYSIGCLMLYLLTDRRDDEDNLSLFNVRKVSRFNADVPVEIEQFLQSMTADDPASRPSTIEKAQRQLDKLLKKQNPAEPHLNRGIAAFNQKLFDRALAEFKRASLLDTSWSTPCFWQAMTHMETGAGDKALALFNRTLELDPDYKAAYYHRGSVLLKLENFTEARKDFDKALEINPKDPRAFFGRAMVFKNLEQFNKAESDFTRALKYDPDNQEFYLQRALTRYEVGMLDAALEDYNKVLLIEPENCFALLGRGLAWSGKGDKYAALDDINKAIDINHAYAGAYLERGIILTELMKWDLALEDLNSALEHDPFNLDGLFYRAKVNYRMRNYPAVVADLDVFIRSDPGVADAYKIRSDAKRRSGDIMGADVDEEMYRTLKVTGDA